MKLRAFRILCFIDCRSLRKKTISFCITSFDSKLSFFFSTENGKLKRAQVESNFGEI